MMSSGKSDGSEEEQRFLMEEVTTIVDFDMLCSMVAMRVQETKWGNLDYEGADDEDNIVFENGEGVFRMWESELVSDCLDDSEVTLQSTCCPCYRFGKNMKRAGWNSGFLQAVIYTILVFLSLFNLVMFMFTWRNCFLYISIAFTVSIAAYLGSYRIQTRKKFNVEGSDSSFYNYHLLCPCCTLTQVRPI